MSEKACIGFKTIFMVGLSPDDPALSDVPEEIRKDLIYSGAVIRGVVVVAAVILSILAAIIR